MKNFSTVGLVFSFAASFACALPLSASAQQGRLPSENVSAARMAEVQAACQFRPDAPDQHLVVRGDTLWAIAGAFLQSPWCWPEVWGLNREQIANPHWIYPGQIVYFDRVAGRLRLGTVIDDNNGAGAPPDFKLSPQIRTEDIERAAVPTISSAAIEPFLTQALVIEDDAFDKAPRIVAIQEGRVYLGKDDKAYVRGALNADTAFQVFRPGKALTDPATGKVIAQEAQYLGAARLTRAAGAGSDVHTFTIATAKEEIGVGDRLLPMPARPIINYAPHRPAAAMSAAVVSIYGGVAYAGQNQVVAINRGQLDGVDVGTVLGLYRNGKTIIDKTAKAGWLQSQKIRLPNEQYGSLFIFRVFKHISYGLIMQVSDTVQVGDGAQSPE